MSREASSVPGAHAEFDRMIASFSACEDATVQEEMRLEIWDRYGATGATFISDMANFSSTSRVRGICHFLKLIQALQASLDVNAELFRLNQTRDLPEHIFMSVGIDYGRLLLIGDEDFYGDPVNTSSQLGEDLAGKSETLVTERALETTDYVLHENAERMVARISEIEISYVKLSMTEDAVT